MKEVAEAAKFRITSVAQGHRLKAVMMQMVRGEERKAGARLYRG